MKSNYLDDLLKIGGFDKKSNLIEWIDGAEAHKKGKKLDKSKSSPSFINGYEIHEQLKQVRESF